MATSPLDGWKVPDHRSDWSLTDQLREMGYGDDVFRQLGSLWAKSPEKAGGRMSLLMCHLLDTAAVAEQMWLHYLPPRTRRVLDEISGRDGKRLFMWLCGIHDCGKATPAFQSKVEPLADAVRAAGLVWDRDLVRGGSWRHELAGAKILQTVLRGVWERPAIRWVWPLVAGHHGRFPAMADLGRREGSGEHHGLPVSSSAGPGIRAAWPGVQETVLRLLTEALGFEDLAGVQPLGTPGKADQLALAGLIVMADWIASSRHFVGIDRLDEVSLDGARRRAEAAWAALELRGGWGQLETPAEGDLLRHRFGQPQRPVQAAAVEIARSMPAPGLVIIEAPMGEGKTKAALAAAEVMAGRFGCDGVFVGMPTQATSDPMFTQVRAWAAELTEDVAAEVALLHGKRRFNPEWRALVEQVGPDPDAEFLDVDVDDDLYGLSGDREREPERRAPAEWFFGRHRGLLCGLAVGTIDQLLHAATRTKHVMLRFAGLAGKVVILDEVHAADVYMQQFLNEALWWLGRAGTPVILLSATLAPGQRSDLARAYLAGAHNLEALDGPELLPCPEQYPSITAVHPHADGDGHRVVCTAGWRPSMPTTVEALPGATDSTDGVVDRVLRGSADGGVVLVVHNTVKRAQATHRALRRVLPAEEVRLLHARLHATHRAERVEECLRLMGPGAGALRPARLVVVATQVAEQSFDVDADLLITDLAPMDLLLQRIGRLHRHSVTRRPGALREPRVVVTGFDDGEEGPRLLPASDRIYGRHLLLRTAARVLAASESGWLIPGDVPGLVAAVYGDEDTGRPDWRQAASDARREWEASQALRAGKAERFLLNAHGERPKLTLEGLHRLHAPAGADEDAVSALVRDGAETVEVVLVRASPAGYAAWDGTPIGVHGEASAEALDSVLGGTVRLPIHLTCSAKAELRPLDGWSDAWLRHARALVLGPDGTAVLGGRRVWYDDDEGLLDGPISRSQ